MRSFLETILSGARSRMASAIGLGLWVFSARLCLVRAGGSAVPFWDQWGGEAVLLYRPWLDGTLRWSGIFTPHNEHRIALTRIADLTLFVLAGAWNPWLQLIFNAVLHSIIVVALLSMFWRALPLSGRAVFTIVLALVFGAPAGWQNALWGFQSQVYFGSLLTVLGVAGICYGKPLSVRWWLGWAASALALWANAGGILASITLLIVSVVRLGGHRAGSRDLLGILLLLLIAIAGGLLNVRAPHHASLHTHSIRQFIAVLSQGLAWPWVNQPWMALVMQVPLVFLGFRTARRCTPFAPAVWCALALGLYAVLHASAVAYSRGGGLLDDRPLSRYQDPLLLGATAQLFAGFMLARECGIVGRITLMLWLTVLASGLVLLSEVNMTLNLPYKRGHDAASLANIRDYVTTGDPLKLNRAYGPVGAPEDPQVMRKVLDEPRLRTILPTVLFAPDPDAVFRPPMLVATSPRLLTCVSFGLLLVLAAQLTEAARFQRQVARPDY